MGMDILGAKNLYYGYEMFYYGYGNRAGTRQTEKEVPGLRFTVYLYQGHRKSKIERSCRNCQSDLFPLDEDFSKKVVLILSSAIIPPLPLGISQIQKKYTVIPHQSTSHCLFSKLGSETLCEHL